MHMKLGFMIEENTVWEMSAENNVRTQEGGLMK